MDWAWWPGPGGGAGWAWTWQAYPGVWAALGLIAAGYAVWFRPQRLRAGSTLAFAAAWVLLWVALDWPLGALAAGRLLTARAAQYLLLSLVIAPLLLIAIGPGLRARVAAGRLAHPLVTLVVFAAVLLLSFLPATVERVHGSAPGGAALIALWLLAGILFWWPVAGPPPDGSRLPYLAGVGYLFVPFVVTKGPGFVFAFSDAPLYPLYERAAAAGDLNALLDQQIAGLVLWLAGSALAIGAIAVLFARWYREDRRLASRRELGLPADPHAVELLLGVPAAWSAVEQLMEIVQRALPAGSSGAAVRFSFERPGRETPQVVLELHVALDGRAADALARRIQLEFAAALARLHEEERASVARRLGFRLVPYGRRVG